MQKTLDDYGTGILITEVKLQKADPPSAVIDAFRDVQAARADRERARNQAEAYANDIIPRARGAAAQIRLNIPFKPRNRAAAGKSDADRR